MSDLEFDRYEAEYEAHRKLAAEALPRNKTLLFDAFAAAGIATVTIEFEGSGDSGQMQRPCARGADEAIIELPAQVVEIELVDWNRNLQKDPLVLAEATEILAWRLLSEAHGGWENNDGGYGQFCFDVAERTITLEMNQRYTETDYHEHIF